MREGANEQTTKKKWGDTDTLRDAFSETHLILSPNALYLKIILESRSKLVDGPQSVRAQMNIYIYIMKRKKKKKQICMNMIYDTG